MQIYKRVLIGIGSTLSLSLMWRLAYIESARKDLHDYDKQLQQAFDNPSLRSAWKNKLDQIDEKYDREAAAWGDCEFSDQERSDYESSLARSEYIPRGVRLNVEVHCYNRKRAYEKDNESMKSLDREALGTYEEWAIKQSGNISKHKWLQYPDTLRARIEKGERGLMMGQLIESFRKIIL